MLLCPIWWICPTVSQIRSHASPLEEVKSCIASQIRFYDSPPAKQMERSILLHHRSVSSGFLVSQGQVKEIPYCAISPFPSFSVGKIWCKCCRPTAWQICFHASLPGKKMTKMSYCVTDSFSCFPLGKKQKQTETHFCITDPFPFLYPLHTQPPRETDKCSASWPRAVHCLKFKF